MRSHRAGPAARRQSRPAWLLPAFVFVVAAAARLAVIFRGAGLRGNFGYDAAVYFAAGDALTHGRLPYRDFVLLHPPGLMVVLAPFSWLTGLTSDDTAFAVACVAFALLGALNAVLVMALCRRLGLGRRSSAAGGLFYAVWFGAVGSEYLTKLEPLGNTLMLCALLLTVRAGHRPSRSASVSIGVALGLLLSVKIWWAAPVLAISVWHVRRSGHRRQAAWQLLAGFLTALAVLDLPFFAAAPRQMFGYVVQDQLGRLRTASIARRFADLSTVDRIPASASGPLLAAGVVVAAVLTLFAGRQAARIPQCRFFVALFALQLIVVLAAPSWFPYYCDYLAVPGAVMVAAAASASAGSTQPSAGRHRRFAGWVPAVAALVLTGLILAGGTDSVVPFQGSVALTRAARPFRCVMSDAPMGLIEINALSRGFADGCLNWVDVSGRTYGADAPTGRSTSRRKNARWQRDLARYLRSGQAVTIVRARGTGMTAATRRSVTRGGLIARSGNHALYRT